MMKDELFNKKGLCNGKERELVEINTDNIEELRSRVNRIGSYGEPVEVGNYAYFDRCGYDSFFVIVPPERVTLL